MKGRREGGGEKRGERYKVERQECGAAGKQGLGKSKVVHIGSVRECVGKGTVQACLHGSCRAVCLIYDQPTPLFVSP